MLTVYKSSGYKPSYFETAVSNKDLREKRIDKVTVRSFAEYMQYVDGLPRECYKSYRNVSKSTGRYYWTVYLSI